MALRSGLLLIAAIAASAPARGIAQTAPARIVPSDRPDQSRPPERPAQRVSPPATASSAAPAVTPFTLQEVVVSGASLPAATLAPAWRPLVGQTLDARGLQQITDAISAIYAREDFAVYTVAVEAQTFASGVLRVRILEGHISAIAIEGPPGARSRRLVEAYGARLQAERPLRRSTLERYVSLIRDIPGLEADMDLEPGPTEGTVRLRVALKPQPVQGALTVSNRGTAFLGRTQVQGDLYLNSLFRQGDQTRVTYATPTRPRLFQFYSLQHVQPIGSDGMTASVSASRLRTRPRGTDLVGHATAAGLQVTYPLQRSYHQDLYLSFGVDGVDNENAFLGFTFADDRTRTLRAAAAFSRRDDRRLSYASISLSRGIDALGARRTDRELSKLGFWKLNGRGGASFAMGESAALRLSAAAQWSPDRLPATEQFALGGDEFGRAYEASIVAGDYGAAAAAELAFAPRALPSGLAGSEAYGFVDAGKVWYRSRFGLPRLDAEVASAGVGVRAKVANRLLVQVEGVRALEEPTPEFDRGDWRGVFLVKAVF